MSIQAVLDRTALIAGGAVSVTYQNLYQGAGGITGVKRAWSRPPDKVEAYDHVSFPPAEDEITIENDTGIGYRKTDYIVRMRLFIAKAGPTLAQSASDALPFVERYLTAFEAHSKLSDLAGANALVSIALIKSVRFEDITYAGQSWLGLAFALAVTEKPTVSLTP